MALKTKAWIAAAAVAAAAVLSSGCQTAEKVEAPDAQKAANELANRPIDTVCIVKHRTQALSTPEILQAVATGVLSTGLKPVVVDAQSVPADCRFCLFYGVSQADPKAQTFDYQAVIDGRTFVKGSGDIGDGSAVSYQSVAKFAVLYIRAIAEQGQVMQTTFAKAKEQAGSAAPSKVPADQAPQATTGNEAKPASGIRETVVSQ